jgi:hypothetical protein
MLAETIAYIDDWQTQDYFLYIMDARIYPRSRLAVPVDLYSNAKNCHLHGKVQDVSVGGMFVQAPACFCVQTGVQEGWQFDLRMIVPGHSKEQHLNAAVRRTTVNGFGLQFQLGNGAQQMVEDLLLPNWDGNNVCEGLIIFASRESIVDFSEWLRLTSRVCNQYRRYARAQDFSKRRGKHKH